MTSGLWFGPSFEEQLPYQVSGDCQSGRVATMRCHLCYSNDVSCLSNFRRLPYCHRCYLRLVSRGEMLVCLRPTLTGHWLVDWLTETVHHALTQDFVRRHVDEIVARAQTRFQSRRYSRSAA